MTVNKFLAVVAISGAAMVGHPTTAEAAPHPQGAEYDQEFWTDCGPEWCTRYYSVEYSNELYEATQGTAWAASRFAMDVMPFGPIIWHKEQMTYDNLEAAASDAVHAGGCVQFQWRQDGRHPGKWSYTTHSGYCFAESYTDASGNVWRYDPDSNSYSAGF